MRCLVTGAAGFIGSHLCEKLLREGLEVVGVDAFIPYYPRHLKEENLAGLWGRPGFTFHEGDLCDSPLPPIVAGADVVVHLAAMPGLARSWTDYPLYQRCNLQATQRLLEAVCSGVRPRRFVYASTSSVYGKFSSGDESLPTRPISPYGVTKLAAEQLCRAYAEAHGLPLVLLRYFSVYGPRQRPDMGYHRFIRALLDGTPVVVYGDGQQVRGNTFVDDCVAATVAAFEAPAGETYNVGGGEAVSVWDVLDKLKKITGRMPAVRQEPARSGDQRTTFADTSRLQRHLGWRPAVGLDEGLARQVAWQRGEGRRQAA